MGFNLKRELNNFVGYFVGPVLDSKLPKRKPQVDSGIEATLPSTDTSIPVIYGKRGRVSGVVVFQSSNDFDDDDIKNDLLHLIIVWCEGHVGSIDQIYLDDVAITDSKFNAWDGLRWVNAVNFTNGMAGYDDEYLVAAGWNPEIDKLHGKACTYLRLDFTTQEGVFSGVPEIKADITGKRIYELNSGQQSASSNPVDQLYDYLRNERYGKGLSSSQIDYQSFLNARSICETQVKTAKSSNSLQSLFTSNVSLGTENSVLDNVNELLSSMRGWLPVVDGKLKLIVEKDDPVVDFELIENDTIVEITGVSQSNKSDRYNRVIATYTDKDANWTKQEAVYPEPDSQTETDWLFEDSNILLEKSITLAGCTDYYEALRYAKTIAEISRQQLRMQCVCTPSALQLDVGDIVPVTVEDLGWQSKPFRIENIETSEDADVSLVCREHQPYVYNWDGGGDKPEIPDTTLNFDRPSDPTQLAVTPHYDDSKQVSLTWQSTLTRFDVVVTSQNGTPLRSERISRNPYEVNGLPVGNYVFSVRSLDSFDRPSNWVDFNFEITVPSTPTGATVESKEGAINVIPPEINNNQIYQFAHSTNSTLNPNQNALTSFDRVVESRKLTISNAKDGVFYYVWYRLKSLEGFGAWVSVSQKGFGLKAEQISPEVISETIPAAVGASGVPGLTGSLFQNMNQFASDIQGLSEALANANGSSDGGIKSFYQASAPSSDVSLGDIWFDTDNDNKIHRYNGTSWVSARDSQVAQAINSAQNAQTTADGKAEVVYSATTPSVANYSAGDLWVNSGQNNRVSIHNGTSWVTAQDWFAALQAAEAADSKAIQAQQVASNAAQAASQALGNAAAAQTTADGKIKSFYQTTAPTSGMSTGDIWFDTDDGNKVYRYSGSSWSAAQDSKIAQAINSAQTAQTTADGKAEVVYASSSPTLGQYNDGDIWIDVSRNYKMFVKRNGGWVLAQDWYAALQNANSASQLASQALGAAANAQTAADGKIRSYFQSNAPSSGMSVGDIWFDTDEGNKAHRFNGTVWVNAQDSKIAQAINSAQTAETKADGKAEVVYASSIPAVANYSAGDLWVNSGQNNKLSVHNGSSWVVAQDYYSALATANAADSKAQSAIDNAMQVYSGTQSPAANVGNRDDIYVQTYTKLINGQGVEMRSIWQKLLLNGVLAWVAVGSTGCSYDEVYGDSRPADNATKGAKWGVDLEDIPVGLLTMDFDDVYFHKDRHTLDYFSTLGTADINQGGVRVKTGSGSQSPSTSWAALNRTGLTLSNPTWDRNILFNAVANYRMRLFTDRANSFGRESTVFIGSGFWNQPYGNDNFIGFQITPTGVYGVCGNQTGRQRVYLTGNDGFPKTSQFSYIKTNDSISFYIDGVLEGALTPSKFPVGTSRAGALLEVRVSGWTDDKDEIYATVGEFKYLQKN